MHSHMVTSCRFFWGGLSLYMVWRTFSTQLDPPVYAYLIFWPHLIWLQNTLVSASNLIIGSWCFYIICSIADPLKQSNAVVHHYFCIQIYRFLSFRRLLSQQVTGDRPFSGIIRGCIQGTRGHRRILKPWSQRKRPGQFWEFLWEFSENWLVNPIMFLGKLPKCWSTGNGQISHATRCLTVWPQGDFSIASKSTCPMSVKLTRLSEAPYMLLTG